MANQDNQMTPEDQANERSEMRLMWIGSGVVALLILGLMGYNWLVNSNLPPDSTEMSSQSRTTPAPEAAPAPAPAPEATPAPAPAPAPAQ